MEYTNKAANFINGLIKVMQKSDEYFSNHDIDWVMRNTGLVVAFFQSANAKRKAGIKRTARGIIEDLRETQSDDSKRFKIANVNISLMAHAFNACLPENYFRVARRSPFGG